MRFQPKMGPPVASEQASQVSCRANQRPEDITDLLNRLHVRRTHDMGTQSDAASYQSGEIAEDTQHDNRDRGENADHNHFELPSDVWTAEHPAAETSATRYTRSRY